MPQVSRLLSEACRDPILWPELDLSYAPFKTEASWRGFLRWLVARASGLQALWFGGQQVRAPSKVS